MSDYSGVDNLEIMAEAENYNNYLLGLVEKFIPKNGGVLDFGAGIGIYAAELLRRGFDVRCLEPDLRLRNIISEKGVPVYEHISDVPRSLNAVYSFNVLEHIEDDSRALADISNMLGKGAILFIYVPAYQCLYSSMDEKVGHFRRYRKADLCSKIREAGFVVSESRYVDCLGFFVTLVYKMIGSREGHISRRSISIYDKLIFPMSLVFDKIMSQLFGKNLLIVAVKE